MGRSLQMGELPFTALLVVLLLSVLITSTDGIDIDNFKGTIVRKDQAFIVGPTKAKPVEEVSPSPYVDKEGGSKKKKEVSILNQKGLLNFVAKRPKDTFIPIKGKDVRIMSKNKVEQFLSSRLDPNKMVQIMWKKQKPSAGNVAILDKPALLKFLAKRPKDTFLPVKAKNVRIMDKTKVEQLFLVHLDPNKKVHIVQKNPSGKYSVYKEQIRIGKEKASTQIMTKNQLEKFKKAKKGYKFIRIPHDKRVKFVNKAGKTKFIQDNPKANIIDISNNKHGITKDRKKFLGGEVVDILTGDQLKNFKKAHSTDNIITVGERLVNFMNGEELKAFKKDKPGSGTKKGYGNKALCQRLLPMLLELQIKQKAITDMISNHYNSKDMLISDRVMAAPEEQSAKQKVEMEASETLSKIKELLD